MTDKTIRSRKRLTEMAALASAKGIPLIFAALPSDIRDFPPPGAAPAGNKAFAAATAALGEKRYPAALSGFESFLGEEPGSAFGLYYRGRALEALGRKGDAASAYIAAAEKNKVDNRSGGQAGRCLNA